MRMFRVHHTTYHNGENTLFHLAGILGAENNHLHPLKVDLNGGRGGHSFCESIGRELASIVDDEVGFTEVLQFFFGGSDKHVVLGINKQSVS